MLKRSAVVLVGTTLLSFAAFAQQATPVDPALLSQGQTLFNSDETSCSACHQSNGVGSPPDFPALAGNAKLSDAALIVGNIHNGKGGMPPFPDLTAEQIAAIATFIRNSWGNAFGGVTPEEVTTLLASASAGAPAAATASIWDGVSNQAQVDRGHATFSANCAKCHGKNGNGAGEPDQPDSPSVARAAFLSKWNGRTLANLFEYVRTTMPIDNPKSRSDQEYIDAIAYMMSLSQAPLGQAELAPDPAALGGLTISPKPQ